MEKPKFNKKNPLLAKLKHSYVLTKEGSGKDTRHYEISLCGGGLEYLPGDSLAVQATNDPEWADNLIVNLGFDPDAQVPGANKEPKGLRDALINDYAIGTPSKKFLKAVAEKTGENSALSKILASEDKSQLNDYLWGTWVVDVIAGNPGLEFTPEEFVGLLQKLNVRLYSISSSLTAVPDEVHLTVATVEYESNGNQRGGVCSTWLAHRLEDDTEIPCFITPGKGFRLPEPDEETPVIMCGPGTGIAPFRSFLQHRKATDAKGDAWLFFGEQHEKTEYFYEDEFAAYQADGTLNKLTTAFSRDQPEKIYVQHRMLEEGADFWAWLDKGAIFYVCGDAARMANDVDEALHRIIQDHGGKSAEEAAEYVAQMKTDKRYRRDVY